jgi:hypothetical protein
MRIYPLTECCTLFGVNLKTLHKWLAREGIHPQRSRADTRIRYLTAKQVASLAEAYDRPLPQREESATQEPRASSAAPLFVDRLDQQEQRILRLETEVRQMQASMALFQQQTSERTCVPGAADNNQQTRQPEQSEKQKADHKRQPLSPCRCLQSAHRVPSRERARSPTTRATHLSLAREAGRRETEGARHVALPTSRQEHLQSRYALEIVFQSPLPARRRPRAYTSERCSHTLCHCRGSLKGRCKGLHAGETLLRAFR